MCPRCKECLIAYELDGVEIDRCIDCGGTWLDSGELELIAELAGAGTGRLTAALTAAGRGTKGKLPCPRCGKAMGVIYLEGGGETIELDRCIDGHGLWLDAGEMQQVIRAYSDGEEGAVSGFFAELYKHDLGNTSKGA